MKDVSFGEVTIADTSYFQAVLPIYADTGYLGAVAALYSKAFTRSHTIEMITMLLSVLPWLQRKSEILPCVRQRLPKIPKN